MREFKSLKQMQRVLKGVGDRASVEFAKGLEAQEVERAKERKLQDRIHREKARMAYANLQKENPLKFKAFVELERLWESGKTGFVKHLALAYGGGNTVPYLGDKKGLKCSLTHADLITFTEMSSVLDELSSAMMNDILTSTQGEVTEQNSETRKILKGRMRALTGNDTTTYLCDDALEALMEFCSQKVDSGQLKLFGGKHRG